MAGPELEGSLKALADKEGDGWRVPPIVPLFGLADQADLDWGLRRFSPQPLRTFTQAAVYATPLEERPAELTELLLEEVAVAA